MPLTDYDAFRAARSGDRAIALFGKTYTRLLDLAFNLASRLQDLATEPEPIKLIRKLFDHIFGRGLFDRWTYDLDELAALEACVERPDFDALQELAEDRGLPNVDVLERIGEHAGITDKAQTAELLFRRFFGKGRFDRDAEGRFIEPPLVTVAKARGIDSAACGEDLLAEVNRVALSDDDVATIMAWARSGYSADVTAVMQELLEKKAEMVVREIKAEIASITESSGDSSTPTSTENTASGS